MDQAAMLSLVGGFYDKLVSDVADKVLAKLAQQQESRPTFDPAALAGELDYKKLADALAGHLDYTELVGSIDYSELAGELNYGSLQSEVDLCDLASELDPDAIASGIDLSEKIREEIRMMLRSL